jgi:hypothetical protein
MRQVEPGALPPFVTPIKSVGIIQQQFNGRPSDITIFGGGTTNQKNKMVNLKSATQKVPAG